MSLDGPGGGGPSPDRTRDAASDAGTDGAAPDGDAGPGTGAARTGTRRARRTSRRAVRPGAGEPDPTVGLRAHDDLDVGWQPPTDGSDDDRLRREVPPHW